MRNKSFTIWLLFLVHGVFGAGEVSVSLMVGDNVTLLTDDSETQGAEKLMWRIQGENTFIAIIDRETSETTVPGNDEERFGGRLGVNSTTGSLTITNLKTTDSRVYELQIKNSKGIKSKIFNVDVRDVVESVSVKEGDSVTLHTGVKLQGDDKIVWKFGVIPITNLNGAVDGGWSKTRLNEQTRDLTISNIRRNQAGDYKMEINSHSMILHRKYSITFSGGMKRVSVKKGDSVTLDTGLFEIKGYDLILWMSEGHVIAEINRTTNQALFSTEEKFEGRLQREHQTGSLTIHDSRITDSGDYHLNMSCSTFTLQRTITVTVTGLSLSEILLIVAGVVVVLLVIIIIVMIIWKKKKILHCKEDEGRTGLERHEGGAMTNPSSKELLPTGQSDGRTDLQL